MVNSVAFSGGYGLSTNLKSSGLYISQYFFGAVNGRCGLRKPSATKKGLSFNLRICSIAKSVVFPSEYTLSATSAASVTGPLVPVFELPDHKDTIALPSSVT